MKSICIKTNNENLLDYLLNELDYIEVKPVAISKNQFKNYKNIIIHYSGNDNKKFVHEVSCILSCLVIDELEESFLKMILLKNYFYFNSTEMKHILELCYEIFSDDFNTYFDKKHNLLIDSFENYLITNKSIILTGFINFRIKNYLTILEDVVDEAVNSFVVEKEYLEFISLLKMYVNSQNSNCDVVHLIYNKNNSTLLDKDKNQINVSDDIFKAKYLSDISFSSNDYALNTLLTLVPKKIHIHLIDNCIDEFIHTISLIFENRVEICTDCSICKIYKNNPINLKKTFIKK
ncbi:MAG: putative sporulation protein YtxC [Clostridia bacterium]|jgi:sporulation protein ytxC